jgi:hypothetical protein
VLNHINAQNISDSEIPSQIDVPTIDCMLTSVYSNYTGEIFTGNSINEEFPFFAFDHFLWGFQNFLCCSSGIKF